MHLGTSGLPRSHILFTERRRPTSPAVAAQCRAQCGRAGRQSDRSVRVFVVSGERNLSVQRLCEERTWYSRCLQVTRCSLLNGEETEADSVIMFGWVLTAPLVVVRWLLAPVPVAALVLLFTWAYYSFTKNFSFWKARGVPGPSPCLPWGNEFGQPFSRMFELETWLYRKHGGKKFCGFFELNKPVLFVGDLDLIRAITIKDFEHFTDERNQLSMDMFDDMLMVLKGEKWKETRSVMSPTFSSSKLKAMYQLTLDNALNLAQHVRNQMADKGEMEAMDAFGRFTMDNIASCAFGVNCNSFTDPNSKFALMAASLNSFDKLSMVRFVAECLLPSRIAALVPTPVEKAGNFFRDVVVKTMAHRERNPSSTLDFLQLLMDTKDKDGKRVLSDRSIVAQSVLFLIAGYNTTATLLTFAAYCLALDQEIQQRVQQEVDEAIARHGGLAYDAVMDMPYLDRVLAETLRMYPPASRIERVCTKTYTLPGTNVHVPAGTVVIIPVYALHRDPDHYPDPLRFDPDRFLPEEKEMRHPCAYIPFGSGPRNCIAQRFALFEAKIALASILREMKLKPTPKTQPHPMPLDKKAFLVSPESGKLPLRAVLREQAN